MQSQKVLGGVLVSVVTLVAVTIGWRMNDRSMASPVPSPSATTTVGRMVTRTVTVGKISRTYQLYLPANYQAGRPTALVVAYHTMGDTPAAFIKQASLTTAADRYGFMVAVPQAWQSVVKPGAPAVVSSWNDGSGQTPAAKAAVDDIGFTIQLVGDAARAYSADVHRVYGIGYAAGGTMALRLAAERPEIFAAVAVGAPEGLYTPVLKPLQATSFMLVYGLADPIVPVASAKTLADRLATMAGCQPATRNRALVPGVTAYQYPVCPRGVTGSLVAVQGMGHTWAGGEGTASSLVVGPVSHTISATEVMWEFLGTHSRL